MTAMALLTIVPALLPLARATSQGGQPSIASVVFTPPTVPGGTGATAVIALTGPAGNNGFTVSLSITSNVATLSSSAITIGSGQSSVQVLVATTPTATAQLATLTATARGESRTGNLTVAAPSVRTLAVAPVSIATGQNSTGTITLDGPAPSGGTVVSLSKSNAAVSVQSSATVAAGQTTTTFAVAAINVATQTAVTLSASAGGVSQSAALTVLAPPLAVVGVLAGNVKSGAQTAVQVTLNNPAPTGGAVVQVATSGVALFSSPFAVTVPEGATVGQREYRAPVTNVDRGFTITAALSGSKVARIDTLRGPRITGVALVDTTLSGTVRSAQLTLTALAESGGLPVTVQSDNVAIDGSNITLDAAFVILRPAPVAQPTTVHLTFRLNGSAMGRSIVLLPAPPTLSTFSFSPSSTRVGATATLVVSLSSAAPLGGAKVALASSPTFTGLPREITVPAGATTATLGVAAPSASAITLLTVTGSLNGGSKSASVLITP
jgi:hypothetical protein